MTKKIINTIIIIVVVVTLAIMEDRLVTNALSEVDRRCSEIQVLASDNGFINDGEILMKLENLSDYWKTKETLITLMVNNKEVRDIGLEVERAKVYLVSNQPHDFANSIASIRYYTDAYLHTMGANFTNIL